MKAPIELIKALEDLIRKLSVYTKHVPVNEWMTILRTMKEVTIDEPEADESWDDLMIQGAAYVAIVQLFFYILLHEAREKKRINREPRLYALRTTGGRPKTIAELFSRVRKISSSVIFQLEVIPRLKEDASSTLRIIIDALEGLSHEFVLKYDMIGQIFQRLLPKGFRKKLAAFYTKIYAAELLSRLTILEGHTTILDPACGSGTLLIQAYHQKKRLLGKQAQHDELISEIVGVDISSFATILACVNLAIQDSYLRTDGVQILNEDAFELPQKKNMWCSPNHQLSSKDFVRQTPDNKSTVEPQGLQVDLVVANPPFTRGSRLSDGEKRKLSDFLNTRGLQHGYATWNLYAFFVLLAPSFLAKEKGMIGLILPRAAIYTRYMEKVWRYLFEKTGLGMKYVINASMSDISFSDSAEQEILIVMEKGYTNPVRMIQLKESLEKCDIENLASNIVKIDQNHFSQHCFEGYTIAQDKLQKMSCREWSFSSPELLESLQENFVPITQFKFVEIGGDTAARPADFFWIPNMHWEIKFESDNTVTLQQTKKLPKFLAEHFPDEKLPDSIEISKEFLVKSLVRNLNEIRTQPPYFNNYFPFIYFLKYKEMFEFPDHAYVVWGELLRRITKTMDGVGRIPRPASIFIPNRIGLKTSKTIALRSPEPIESTRCVGTIFIPLDSSKESQRELDVLFAYLTSSIFLLDYINKSRVGAGTFRRLYATDVKDKLRFPNIPKLSEKQKKEIIAVSNKHNRVISLNDRPSFAEEVSNAQRKDSHSTLRCLDEVWFRALNLPLENLDVLYTEILEKIGNKSIKCQA